MRTQAQELSLVGRIMKYADKHNIGIDYYHGCAESGYDDQSIIAANWNGPSVHDRWAWKADVSGERQLSESGKKAQFLERVSKVIDDMEAVSLEWSDEWDSCSVCNKAVRTSPDSYGWTASYVMTEHDLICRECWEDNLGDIVHEYVSDYHHGLTNKALPPEFARLLEREGWICWNGLECNRYETGFHPGQNDDPHVVFESIMEQDKDLDVLFVINDVGQFDVRWSAWVKPAE